MEVAVEHHRHIAATLLQTPESYRPYLSGFSEPLDAAAEWADGFRHGLHLYPEMHALLDHQDALTLMTGVLGLLRDEDVPEELRAGSPFRELPPARRAALRRETTEMLPEIVPALHRHALDLNEAKAAAAAISVRQAPKVGRNDPCPCGSGKKYKKCCIDQA
ncbi:MAG: SEC-C metal-binding domain-containing protein [Hyphomicrobiaceae bacterium]